MSDTLILLRLEHDNMAQLLDIVEVELGKLHQAEEIDYALIGSVVDYLRSYGEECHHPKEDRIFRALCRRNAASVKDIGDIARGHDALAQITEALARELEAAEASGARASRLKLKTPLAEFLAAYRRHLALEEDLLFPAALRELTEEDWEEIDFDTFDRKDPLFSDAIEGRFDRLREHILTRPG